MADDRATAGVVYSHTQVAVPTVALLAVAFVGQLSRLIAAYRDRRQRWAALASAAAGLLAAYLLSSLTVRVCDDAVELWFTGRLVRRRVPLADVTEVQVIQVPWWSGFGVRLRETGLLFNVWGRQAVELRLADGSTVAVGSDEPHRLAAAVQTALAALPPRRPTPG